MSENDAKMERMQQQIEMLKNQVEQMHRSANNTPTNSLNIQPPRVNASNNTLENTPPPLENGQNTMNRWGDISGIERMRKEIEQKYPSINTHVSPRLLGRDAQTPMVETTTRPTPLEMEACGIQVDIIVNGEALPKERNYQGYEMVIIPVLADSIEVVPYSVYVTVLGPIDPSFPQFRTTISIDGRECSSRTHSYGQQVLKLTTYQGEYLGFGPIPRSPVASITREEGVRLGMMTVEVTNCKVTGTKKRRHLSLKSVEHATLPGFTVKKEMKKYETQCTKWKTVSAGKVPTSRSSPSLTKTMYDYGSFCEKVTVLYMDSATMDHNRRLMMPPSIETGIIDLSNDSD